jgi:predicted RNase H-like HicB family nuclease
VDTELKKAYLCSVNKKVENTMEYSIIIEKNPKTGVYVGQCSQLPEAMSQGNTLAELMANMKEAIELAIECRREELKELYKNRKVFHRRLTVNA